MEVKAKAKEAAVKKTPVELSSQGSKRKEKEAQKNEGKPVSIGAIISVLLILIIVSLLALVYFDLLGFKDMAVKALSLDQPTNSYMKDLVDLENNILELQADLDAREAALVSKGKELDKREKEIVKLEEELTNRQEALTQMQIFVEGLHTDIGALALMMEGMSPVKAAEVLSALYNTTDIARILVAMKSESASKILDNMQPERAAGVVAEMLRYAS